MLWHLIIPTCFGDVVLVYTEPPFLIKKIFLPHANRKALAKILAGEGWGRPGCHKKALVVSKAISDYFEGKPIDPPWEWMDMNRLTLLQKSVLNATADIPYGKVSTYKGIAAAISCPRAYRFVGTTLAKNPFPFLIPCHRVIRSNLSLGQFEGGAELKKKMIEFEAGQSHDIKCPNIHLAHYNKL